MDRASLARFVPRLRPGGLLIVNSSLIDTWRPREDAEVLALPATEAAAEIGNQVVANVVMLGALLARRPIVALDTLAAVMTKTAHEMGRSGCCRSTSRRWRGGWSWGDSRDDSHRAVAVAPHSQSAVLRCK